MEESNSVNSSDAELFQNQNNKRKIIDKSEILQN